MADKRVELEFKATSKGDGLKDAAQQATKLENSVRDLRQELAKSNQRFEEAKASSIQLRAEWKRMDRSGAYSKDQMDEQSRAIEKASTAQLAAIRSSQKLVGEVRELGDETGITANSLDIFAAKLQESERYVTGVGGAAKLAAEKSDQLRNSVDNTTHSIDRLGDESAQTNRTLDKIDDSTSQATSALKRMGSGVNDAREALNKIEKKSGIVARAMGNILADTVQDAAQAFVEFAKVSYESFRGFDDEARRVFAQARGMSAAMRGNLTGDAKVIAAQIGRVPQETLPALRKALNLGISEDNLLSSIETASMAARVGGESLIDTMVLGQSVVNAYGGELYSLNDAYDQLNYITQSSNLEFGDLNANMNEIISAAAEAGIGLDSVAGAMVTMNRQGDDASEIGGLLSNVLTQISIEGTALGSAFKEAAGVGFREFTAAGGTLSEGLQILQAHAQDTGQDLLNMVGGSSPFYRDVQAARGVLELTGKHAAELAENTAAAAEATGGLAAAAAEFEDSPALTYDRATASVENLKISFGEWLAMKAEEIDLIENSNIVAGLLSGTLLHQVEKQTKQIVEAAQATEDYDTALQQLKDGHIGGASFGLSQPVSDATKEIVSGMARASESYEDFAARVAETNASISEDAYGSLAVLNGYQFDVEAFYLDEMKKAAMELFEVGLEIESSMEMLYAKAAYTPVKTGNGMAQFYANAARGFKELTAQSSISRTEAFLFNDAIEAQSSRVEGNAGWLERMAENSAELAEQQALLAEHQQWVTTTTAGYYNEISNGLGAQRGLYDVVEQTAIQYGATAEQQAILKYGMGELTREALLQQLTLAATQGAAAELGRKYAEGEISAFALREELALLAQDSPYEAIAEVDTENSLLDVSAINRELDILDGRHTSSTHTHTSVTVTSHREDQIRDDGTTTSTPPPTASNPPSNYTPPNDDDRIPQYSGGDMFPGNAYLVGDTASGGRTPYSEIIVPQQHMVNLGVQGSKGLLNGDSGGDTYIFQIAIEGNRHDVDHVAEASKNGVLEAAAQIGLRL